MRANALRSFVTRNGEAAIRQRRCDLCLQPAQMGLACSRLSNFEMMAEKVVHSVENTGSRAQESVLSQFGQKTALVSST